jgi:ribose-phosphate pyrophosphokinase
MIKVNDIEIKVEHFPDGTQRIMNFPDELVKSNPEWPTPYFEIVWTYENDSEMFTLHCVVEHLRRVQNYSSNMVINLVMPYVPNGRLDRIYSDNEVFTLKYFADFINSLNFNKVGVFDPHSNVTTALIDRVTVMDNILDDSLRISLLTIANELKTELFDDEEIVIYFPDESAYKRYKKYFSKGLTYYMYYGKKVRDWKTGQILGLEIYNKNDEKISEKEIKGRVFLMVDDIISYGGSMAYGADKLKELGASHIYAYASHVENSILDTEKGTLIKRLNDNVVDKVFTTNSLYTGNNDKIKIIYNF